MIGIELTNFDQATTLLVAFSALALIRERTVIPYVICVVGGAFQGALVSVMLSALIIWHRMLLRCEKSMQLRDFAAFFFLLGAALVPEIERSFYIFMGTLLLSVSLGGSALGTLPALLLVRQFHPLPEYLELALVGHALYWIVFEISKWTEIKNARAVLSWAEVLGSLLILVNLRGDVEAFVSDGLYSIFGGMVLVFIMGVSIWRHFKPESFVVLQQRLRAWLKEVLFWGGRLISGDEPWANVAPRKLEASLEQSISRVFWWVFGIGFGYAIILVMLRGGG